MNMTLSRATTFAVISALAMLSLAAPSSAQQAQPRGSAPVAQPAPAIAAAGAAAPQPPPGAAARGRACRAEREARNC